MNRYPTKVVACVAIVTGLMVVPLVVRAEDRTSAPAVPVDASVEYLIDSVAGPADPEAFREVFSQYLLTMGSHTVAVRELADTQVEQLQMLSYEEMEVFVRLFPDPERLIQLMEQHMDALAQRRQSRPEVLSEQPQAQTSTCAGPPLPAPDYGSNVIGSPYQDVFLDLLADGGYIPSDTSNADRCDNNEFASLTETLEALRIANAIGSAACQLAGCDPIGIACAVVCGLTAILDATTEIVSLTEASCNAHNGTIDSAEIEAGYENTIIISGQVCVVDEKVDILDGKVDDALDKLDEALGRLEDLRKVNCELMRLIHTPSGQRDADCPVCDDNAAFPFDWPEH